MPNDSECAPFSTSSALLSIALTLVAGYIDAIGYLNLGHVYVANMSGNSIAVGIGAGWRDTARLARYGLPIFSFFIGLVLSRVLVSWGIAQHWRSLAAPALALELVALIGFVAFARSVPGVVFGGAAMGIQAATLSRFNGATVYTCFVTGSLVKGAENASNIVVRLVSGAAPDARHVRAAVWFIAVWIAYACGAMAGTVALGGFGIAAIGAAIAGIATMAVFDLISPTEFDRSVRT